MSAVENVPLAEELAALVRHGYTAGHVANRFGIEVADTESWLRALDQPYPCAPFFGRSGGCERCPGFARCREHDPAGLWVLCEMPRPDQVARAVLEGKYEPPDGYRPAWLPVPERGEITMNEIVQYLDHSRLSIHPRNMRRVYPPDDVAQMAQSIREHGVILPLIAVQGGSTELAEVDSDGSLYVVAGNLRLAALRTLGDEAPAVPVIVRRRSEEEQLLDMAVENAMRFDPDPVSEGLHYKRIIEQPGMSVNRLYKITGIAPATIHNRLAWAALEPEIQELGTRGRLPIGAADHLIKLPAGQDRIRLGKRFASSSTTLRGIQRACRRYLDELGVTQAFERDDPNGRAVALAKYLPEARHTLRGEIDTRSAIRLATAEACHQCPVRDDLGTPEPAWSILAHGAREACEACGLDYLRDICGDCPLVHALRYAYRNMARQEGLVPHETF